MSTNAVAPLEAGITTHPKLPDFALSMRDVNVYLPTAQGELRILRDINFDVPRGSVVALAGESGSGKSTAMLTALRLLPWGARVEGDITAEGVKINELGPAELRRFRASRARVIFQDPWSALHAMHSIGDQLIESARSADPALTKAQARAIAEETLLKVGISDPTARMKSYPHQVSGGQLQRIVIAMALVASPTLLLCDEPTTALDVTTQEQILELLRELKESLGLTIVIATHDLDVIDGLADRLVVMYGGTIVEQGEVKTVLSKPQHPYTWAMLEAAPDRNTHERLRPIEGRPPALDDLPAGCAFAPRCTSATEICRTFSPVLTDIDGTGSHSTACTRVQLQLGVAPEGVLV
jgi:oligopeptide/dipeptide ABC transporter ATP-binding protein